MFFGCKDIQNIRKNKNSHKENFAFTENSSIYILLFAANNK